MVGALTLGSALPHLFNGAGGLRWEYVILATSVLTTVGAAIAFVAVREGPFPFARASFDPRQAGQLVTNRGVRLASIGYFGHMWELYAMWAWFFAFFTDSLADDGYGGALLPFTYQVDEWNALWNDLLPEFIEAAANDGIPVGWVRLDHNTGGPHNSKHILLFDNWNAIEAFIFERVIGTLREERPAVWQRVNALLRDHDDVVWVPIAQE